MLCLFLRLIFLYGYFFYVVVKSNCLFMFVFVVKLFYLKLNVVVFKKVKIKLGNVVMVFDNVYR